VSYPVVEKVLQHYGQDKIYYTLNIFPLWLHRQAFIVAEAAGVVALNAPERTCCSCLEIILPTSFVFSCAGYWDAAQFLFANQAQFFNSVYANKTANDLYATHCPILNVVSAGITQYQNNNNRIIIYVLWVDRRYAQLAGWMPRFGISPSTFYQQIER
jgi:hypothetical protein